MFPYKPSTKWNLPSMPATVSALTWDASVSARFPTARSSNRAAHSRSSLRSSHGCNTGSQECKSKLKATIARLHQHIANVRRDFIEKVSLEICKNHAEIFSEDLKIKNMTASAKGTVEEPGSRVAQKSGLNRCILDQGWGIFFPNLIGRR